MNEFRRSIVFVFSSLKFGGAERVALTLARELKEKGVLVTFVLMRQEGEFLAEASKHFEVVDLQCDRTWKLPFKLGVYVVKTRPFALISSFWKINLCACLVRILHPNMRLLLWEHSQPSKSINSPTWLYAITATVLYRLATKVIAVSSGVREDVTMITFGLRDKIRVIFNPIPPPGGTNIICQNKFFAKRVGKRLVWVGRIDIPKNPLLMLEAFALLPRDDGFTLNFIGDGPMRDDLESRASAMNLDAHVYFRGFQVDPYSWMQQADVLVLSSDREGFGNVLVEALYCGLGVVSTDCGEGIHEILLDGELGAIVPQCKPAALAEAIKLIANSLPEKSVQIASALRFHPTTIADQFLEELNDKSKAN